MFSNRLPLLFALLLVLVLPSNGFSAPGSEGETEFLNDYGGFSSSTTVSPEQVDDHRSVTHVSRVSLGAFGAGLSVAYNNGANVYVARKLGAGIPWDQYQARQNASFGAVRFDSAFVAFPALNIDGFAANSEGI